MQAILNDGESSGHGSAGEDGRDGGVKLMTKLASALVSYCRQARASSLEECQSLIKPAGVLLEGVRSAIERIGDSEARGADKSEAAGPE